MENLEAQKFLKHFKEAMQLQKQPKLSGEGCFMPVFRKLVCSAVPHAQAATGDWTPDLFKYMEGKWQDQPVAQ